MPKTPTSSRSSGVRRHDPLAEEYIPEYAAARRTPRPSKRRKSLRDDERDQDAFGDARTSQKILQIGQDLVDEDREEVQRARAVPVENPAFSFGSRFPELGAGAQDDADGDDGEGDGDDAWGDEEEGDEGEDVDPHDLDLFNRFNPPSFDDPILRPGEDEPTLDAGGTTNLADLILEKIAEHEAKEGGVGGAPIIHGGGEPEDAVELPAKVVEVFTKIGHILSRYKSGPLPKPLKMLPTLPQWDILLSISRPDQWTPHAVQAMTRIFVSGNAMVAQGFVAEVLLPAVRTSIHETSRLPVQLYAAVKKALYKPAAFFKGLLFPLLASGTATLREAQILASVLQRVSVPVLHSAAALLRLCDLAAEQMTAARGGPESAGAANLCIRVLLEKRYALPYRVVDALVFHFLRFRIVAGADGAGGGEQAMALAGRLPVIWHQCLLAFAQRYKNDITEEQREALLDLLLERGHGAIGPEVRRELLAGRGRGIVAEPRQGMGEGGDDTMVVDS